MANRDLWGLGAESLCIVASLAFAKVNIPLGDHFGKTMACYDT